MFCSNGANASFPISKLRGPALAPADPEHSSALFAAHFWKSVLAYREDGGPLLPTVTSPNAAAKVRKLPASAWGVPRSPGETVATVVEGLVVATRTGPGEGVNGANDGSGGAGGLEGGGEGAGHVRRGRWRG